MGSMDDETKALFVFASRLARYSDSDIVILNTEPLREILEQTSEDAPDSCESSARPHWRQSKRVQRKHSDNSKP